MAENALKIFDTDYCIATTGLAGPDSDGTDTEIGTVYIAVAAKDGKTTVIKNCYKTVRSNFIDRTSNAALFEMWKKLSAPQP